jgi:hypothetical protein
MDTSNQNPHNEFVKKINPHPLPSPFNISKNKILGPLP